MGIKNKLKNILNAFENSDDKLQDGFKAFDSGVAKLKSELREKIQVATLDDVNSEIEKFRKRIDLTPLTEAIEQIKTDVQISDRELRGTVEEKLSELRTELSDSIGKSKDSTASIQKEIDKLETTLLEVSSRKFPDFPDFLTPIKESETKIEQKILESINEIEKFNDKDLKDELKKLEETIEKLRKELMNRLNERGGGSMNRQVLFNTTNYLKKYTDYNLIPGNNVTFTVTEDNTNKRVNLRIDATGGGGGSTRSINNVSTNTAAGSTASTDYVYICSGTITITMPPTVGNTNLYTIKNAGTGVITIVASGADTLDNDINIIMPLQYTSVDLISDGVNNWNIT